MNHYQALAVYAREQMNSGDCDGAFQTITEALHGQILNNLRLLPANSRTFDQEDFIQDINLHILEHMDDYEPFQISVRPVDTMARHMKLEVALQHAVIDQETYDALNNLTTQLNRNIGTRLSKDLVIDRIENLSKQYPALEFRHYISTLPAFFDRWLRKTLDKYTCEFKGISPNDNNRLRRRKAKKSVEKTAKTNFILDQLERRQEEPDVPISAYEEDFSGQYDRPTSIPKQLQTLSAEADYWNGLENLHDSNLTILFDQLHVKKIATTVKKKLILKHQLEVLTSEPIDIAIKEVELALQECCKTPA